MSSLDKLPPASIKADQALAFQALLRISHHVLPPFPKVDSVDDTIYRVVAEIRVDTLNQGVYLSCRKRITAQQIKNGSGENRVGGLSWSSPKLPKGFCGSFYSALKFVP